MRSLVSGELSVPSVYDVHNFIIGAPLVSDSRFTGIFIRIAASFVLILLVVDIVVINFGSQMSGAMCAIDNLISGRIRMEWRSFVLQQRVSVCAYVSCMSAICSVFVLPDWLITYPLWPVTPFTAGSCAMALMTSS